MKATFHDRLTAEVVRALEHKQPLAGAEASEKSLAATHSPLEEKVLSRAKALAREHRLGLGIHRVLSQSAWLAAATGGLFFVLGALAGRQAFSHADGGTVNFYWLLVILLGSNLLALGFWAASLAASLRSGGDIAGIGGWLQGLQGKWSANDSRQSLVYAAVHRLQWTGNLGRWMLSRLSHTLWLCYLAGGLAMIVLMLATRQFDFVWETTLLGAREFVALTEFLAQGPAALGFAVPLGDQIILSQPDSLPTAAGDHLRRAWASLLLGCLLLYGVLPRVALLAFSQWALLRARSRYRLPLSLPYYIDLRARLLPAIRAVGVVDPDRQGPPPKPAAGTITTDTRLPANALYTGIELNPDQPWPPPGISPDQDLGTANDGAGQQRIVASLATRSQPLVAVIPVQRTPDRGLERLLRQLQGRASKGLYLALSQAEGTSATGSFAARLEDWFALAAAIGLPADAIVRLGYVPSPHGGTPAHPGAQRHD
jgi:hypothetical protein